MANRTTRKSSSKTPKRQVGQKTPAKRPVGRNARRIKAPRPKVDQPPVSRDARGTRHGEEANKTEPAFVGREARRAGAGSRSR